MPRNSLVVRAPEHSLHGRAPGPTNHPSRKRNRMLSVPSRCGDTHRKQNTILAGSRAALPSSTPTAASRPHHTRCADNFCALTEVTIEYCHRHCYRTLALVPHLPLPTRSPGSAAAGSPQSTLGKCIARTNTQPSPIPLPTHSSKQPPQQRSARLAAGTHARTTQEQPDSLAQL